MIKRVRLTISCDLCDRIVEEDKSEDDPALPDGWYTVDVRLVHHSRCTHPPEVDCPAQSRTDICDRCIGRVRRALQPIRSVG